MTQYIVVLGFFVFGFILMASALHFSKYKKRASGCCGAGHCSSDASGGEEGGSHSCYSSKMEFVKNYKRS